MKADAVSRDVEIILASLLTGAPRFGGALVNPKYARRLVLTYAGR
jgi:hypothetical protein